VKQLISFHKHNFIHAWIYSTVKTLLPTFHANYFKAFFQDVYCH